MMKKVIIAGSVVAGVLFGTFLVTEIMPKQESVHYLTGEQAFNTRDKKQLVGWADNVFIGTVVKKDKQMTDSLSPITLYDVNVLETIKGSKDSSSRTIKISHRAGYDEEQGAYFTMEGDVETLKANAKYLFVTKYDEATQSHRVVSVEVNILLETPEEEKKVKEEFIIAAQNQVEPNYAGKE